MEIKTFSEVKSVPVFSPRTLVGKIVADPDDTKGFGVKVGIGLFVGDGFGVFVGIGVGVGVNVGEGVGVGVEVGAIDSSKRISSKYT